jgi:hypothetical protein
MPHRSTINQNTQIVAEATPGTILPATRLLRWGNWKFGIEAETKMYRGTGRKYAVSSALNKEWSKGSVDGPLDFNAAIYPLNGAMGTGTIAASGTSATAKTHTFIPPISGNTSNKTFSIENGETATRAQKFAYGLFTKFGYKGTRSEFTCNAELIGQLTSDNITMTTAGLTTIALAPSSGNQWNVWMDATSAGLGTTQLVNVVDIEFDMSDIYGPAWFINRSMPSWTAHIDKPPKTTFKITQEADANGMLPLADMRAGTTKYIRAEAQGNQIAADGPGAVYNSFVHDMAVKFTKPTEYKDADGIYAIGWECEIIEDSAWGSGQAQKLVITNLLTAL